MLIVVSPYHITTREVPAMAAFLLADHVVTYLPAPAGRLDAAALAGAVARTPRYLRLMESWEWCAPLFEAGVVGSEFDGEDAAGEVRRVYERIESDPALADLRAFMRAGVMEDEGSYLHAIAGDVLKGGPDPALSVPVAAALDRFAARRGLLVARSEARSMAQRAEEALSSPLFSIALPVLAQSSGTRLLLARELLASSLSRLRFALDEEIGAAGERGSKCGAALRGAVERFAGDFEAMHERLTEPEDGEGRAVAGVVTIAVSRIPANAALSSSVDAARTLRAGKRSAAPSGAALPVLRDEASGLTLVTLVVRALGAHARRR